MSSFFLHSIVSRPRLPKKGVVGRGARRAFFALSSFSAEWREANARLCTPESKGAARTHLRCRLSSIPSQGTNLRRYLQKVAKHHGLEFEVLCLRRPSPSPLPANRLPTKCLPLQNGPSLSSRPASVPPQGTNLKQYFRKVARHHGLAFASDEYVVAEYPGYHD